MDIEQLAKGIKESMELLRKSNYNWNYERGKGSKSYTISLIDILRQELLDMKKEIKNN